MKDLAQTDASPRRSWLTLVGWLVWQVIFTVWWGGLTFYAAVVVHLGTQILGSERQGFVTQRVTYVLNALGTAVVVGIFLHIRRKRQAWPWIIWGALCLTQIGLFIDHWRLSGFLDYQTQTIAMESKAFYNEHAVYLWLTTIQWGAGLAWLVRSTIQGERQRCGVPSATIHA